MKNGNKTVWVYKVIACFVTFWAMGVMLMHPVMADVIYEPRDDFYEENRDRCVYKVREYTTNGVDGRVKIYKSPKTNRVVTTIDNGKGIWISYLYEDDKENEWGFYEDLQTSTSGWIPMKYLNVVYDHIAFGQDYAEFITKQEGRINTDNIKDFFYGWNYPGAKNNYPFVVREVGELPTGHEVFVDCNGHEWGKVPYYMGNRNFWVCLDAPSAEYEELFPEGWEVYEETEPIIWTSDTKRQGKELTPAVNSNESQLTYILVGLLIAAVVIGTGIILFSLRKQGKK